MTCGSRISLPTDVGSSSRRLLGLLPSGSLRDSREGGRWTPLPAIGHWDDKPRWSPDGNIIYYVSDRHGFFNVWGIRFDQLRGVPAGKPFPVTKFESPNLMVPTYIAPVELSITEDRLALNLAEVSGSIWMLETVK